MGKHGLYFCPYMVPSLNAPESDLRVLPAPGLTLIHVPGLPLMASPPSSISPLRMLAVKRDKPEVVNSAVQCSEVQCSAVQCSAVQCRTVKKSALPYSEEECSAEQ